MDTHQTTQTNNTHIYAGGGGGGAIIYGGNFFIVDGTLLSILPDCHYGPWYIMVENICPNVNTFWQMWEGAHAPMPPPPLPIHLPTASYACWQHCNNKPETKQVGILEIKFHLGLTGAVASSVPRLTEMEAPN